MAENKKEEAKKNTEAELKKEFDEEKIKEEILSKSEIALWLDTYEDIFSDFDPRPFSQRAVSVDFLDEIRRASRDKASGQIELRFLIPENLRKENEEAQIKKRLKDHFRKHAEELKTENKKTMRKGFFMAGVGFILMFLAVTISYFLGEKLITHILTTLFEPSGWFLMFYGLDTAFYTARVKEPEIEFNEKMSKAEINFVTY